MAIRLPWRFIGVSLILILLGLGLLAWQLSRSYQVSIQDVLSTPIDRVNLVKLINHLQLDVGLINQILAPPIRYKDHPLDGRIKPSYPRIVLPELANWDGQKRSRLIANRLAAHRSQGTKIPPLRCASKYLMHSTACWIQDANEASAIRAIDKLKKTASITPNSFNNYGNGWELALAYDLLATSPLMTEADHTEIRTKLAALLGEYLAVLDEESASLWHGRASLAANAWLLAIVLDPANSEHKALIRRAQGHFLDSMQALAITEVWPEGYNYWINNRAFYISLAAASYVNGLEDAEFAAAVKDIIEQTGLWHIYATRPDRRIEGFGDEGPRMDLKDETRRAVDLMAGITGNKALAEFSAQVGRQHGIEGYYRGYRWGFILFNDPLIQPATHRERSSLAISQLPQSRLFGQGASNHLYINSSWGRQATHISFHAGHIFAHHQHYAAGHFTLYKSAPLAVNSSSYTTLISDNRLNYAIRSVAKNTLLIQRPNAVIKPDREFAKQNVNDGGQRLVIPMGSALISTDHWRENLNQGLMLAAAELADFVTNDHVTYMSANLTRAYDSGHFDTQGEKGAVNLVLRSLLYLHHEDVLLVKDRISTTQADYRTKWLLHSINKPELEQLEVLKGESDNGISKSLNNHARILNGSGVLDADILLPEQPLTHVVGGPDFRFYVETDGDDSQLDGQNFPAGASNGTWFDQAFWRLEIMPEQQTQTTHYLVALSPSVSRKAADSSVRQPVKLVNQSKSNPIAQVGKTLVIYIQDRQQSIEFTADKGIEQIVLVGDNRARLEATSKVDKISISSSEVLTRVEAKGDLQTYDFSYPIENQGPVHLEVVF